MGIINDLIQSVWILIGKRVAADVAGFLNDQCDRDARVDNKRLVRVERIND